MAHPTPAVQLIVFGKRNMEDIDGVLKDVAAAGFPAFEAGDLFEVFGEETTRRVLDAHKLTISGAHFGYGEYLDANHLDAHVAYAKALGIRNMMCSGVANNGTADGYRESAHVFNAVGKLLQDEGINFNYHNHAWEFDDLGGTNGMEILAAETDPKLVKFNMDVFWLYYGGQDPADFIAKHADRAGYFHFKDGLKILDESGRARPQFLELGRGDIDLSAAYAAAVQAGAQWIVAEQDSTLLPALESVTITRNYLRDELGI